MTTVVRRMASRIVRLGVVASSAIAVLPPGCATKPKEGPEEPPPPPPSPARVPPALAATPVAAFADAGGASPDEPPRVTAQRYREGGQLWLARLVLEKTALGASADEADVLLLATICTEQGDASCVAACEEKLGRKVSDAGAPAKPTRPVRSRGRAR